MRSRSRSKRPARATRTTTTRIYFADGHVEHFRDQVFALAVWLALPKGVRVAFRGRNDIRPVYRQDRVDIL